MALSSVTLVSFTAPVNIALIKYWGKRDEVLILPLAGSISITLHQNHMCAKTTVACSKSFSKNQFWLNGEEQSMDNPRLAACLAERKIQASCKQYTRDRLLFSDKLDRLTVRNRASRHELREEGNHLRIVSVNNFPTGAGLASSAAGFACLVSAVAKLYGVRGDISDIARRGSGSACRSTHGGFVEWVRGESEDGRDSIGRPIAPAFHWPELRILVLVVNDRRKSVGSTEAMKRGVETSDFIQYWANHVVPKQISLLKEAILNKDFSALAELTMKASNQLHALCMEAYPPVIYMNQISHSIMNFVHSFNSACNQTRLAYTFDAGPNACLLLQQDDVPIVANLLSHYFPVSQGTKHDFFRGLSVDSVKDDELENLKRKMQLQAIPGGLHYVLHTQVGDAPMEVEDHLLDETGAVRAP